MSIVVFVGFVVKFMVVIGVEWVYLVGYLMGGVIVIQVVFDVFEFVVLLMLIGSVGLGFEVNNVYMDGFVNVGLWCEFKLVLELLFVDLGLVSCQLVDDVFKYKCLDGVGELLVELGSVLFGEGK